MLMASPLVSGSLLPPSWSGGLFFLVWRSLSSSGVGVDVFSLAARVSVVVHLQLPRPSCVTFWWSLCIACRCCFLVGSAVQLWLILMLLLPSMAGVSSNGPQMPPCSPEPGYVCFRSWAHVMFIVVESLHVLQSCVNWLPGKWCNCWVCG